MEILFQYFIDGEGDAAEARAILDRAAQGKEDAAQRFKTYIFAPMPTHNWKAAIRGFISRFIAIPEAHRDRARAYIAEVATGRLEEMERFVIRPMQFDAAQVEGYTAYDKAAQISAAIAYIAAIREQLEKGQFLALHWPPGGTSYDVYYLRPDGKKEPIRKAAAAALGYGEELAAVVRAALEERGLLDESGKYTGGVSPHIKALFVVLRLRGYLPNKKRTASQAAQRLAALFASEFGFKFSPRAISAAEEQKSLGQEKAETQFFKAIQARK